MSAAQERSYRDLFPRYSIPFSMNALRFEQAFNNDNPVICEIGFGMGFATAEIAGANPDKNYLGIEVYKAGIGRLLWEIGKRRIENIKIIEYDAVEVLRNMVSDGAFSGFHIFFPDPWPKKRHHKRRLVQRPFTTLLSQKLKTGGSIYMVTDWDDYAVSALEELNGTDGLANAYDGFAPRKSWRPQTKFERKGLAAAREIRELYFIKTQSYPLV